MSSPHPMSAALRTIIMRTDALPRWQPSARDHLLIFAPHPDDETLATGGVIASALRQLPPEQILVIIATNGDASRLAAFTASKRPPTRQRQQDLALLRQQESLDALSVLGLDDTRVQFWGFPDAGLQHIWQKHWGDQLYRSGATGFESARQARNAPQRPYTARALLSLIIDGLTTFRPTVILTPHPADAHPDHSALAKFVQLGVALHRQAHPGDHCEMLAYPMWLQARPIPRSIRFPDGSFQLPGRFTQDALQWVTVPFLSDVRNQRAEALRQYRSQSVTVRGLLKASAVSSYEAFGRLTSAPPPLPNIPGLSMDSLHHTLQ